MAKKTVESAVHKEKKNLYQTMRESMGWTREEASEHIPGMTPERLEKIEHSRIAVKPEDISLMAKAYHKPELYNYYCANECCFKDLVGEVEQKEFTQATVEIINSLNRLNREKDRMLEIAEDGELSEDEIEDFKRIKGMLNRISSSIDNLQLWIDKQIAEGAIKEKDLGSNNQVN